MQSSYSAAHSSEETEDTVASPLINIEITRE